MNSFARESKERKNAIFMWFIAEIKKYRLILKKNSQEELCLKTIKIEIG